MSGKRKTRVHAPEQRVKATPAKASSTVSSSPSKARRSPSAAQPTRRWWTRAHVAGAAVLGILVLVGVILGVRGAFSGGSTEKLETKTVEELERLAVRRPNDARVLFHYGTALLRKGAANDASGVFQRVLQLDARNVNAQLGLGQSLSRLGDLGGAETAFKKAAELDPSSYDAQFQLMRLYHENGEPQSARQAIKAALRIRRSEASGWYALGHLNGLLREEAAAARAFEQASVLAPNQPANWRALGRVYWHMDRLGEAEGALKRALALKPNDPHALWWLGQVYLKLPDSPRNRAQASEALQKATAAGQRPLPEAHVELARLYLRNDQPLLAEQSLRTALRLNPELEPAHFELGRLLTRLGRKAEGEKLLARYEATSARRRKMETLEGKARQNPNDAASLLELARLYRDYRNVPAAMRTYRRYLTLRSQDQSVVEEMTAFRLEVMPQPADTTASDATAENPFPEQDHYGHTH